MEKLKLASRFRSILVTSGKSLSIQGEIEMLHEPTTATPSQKAQELKNAKENQYPNRTEMEVKILSINK